MINIILIISATLLLLGSIIFLQRKYTLPIFYVRKFLHVFFALFGFVLVAYVTKIEYVIINLFFVIVFLLLYLQKRVNLVEVYGKKNLGSVLYPISLVLMGIFLFGDLAYMRFGLLILGIPDTVASFVNFFKKSTRKTILSSVAYFISALVISLFFLDIQFAIIFSIIATIIERYSPRGTDNLTVPIFTILFYFFLSFI